MTRRGLIVAAAALLIGAAWWLSLDRLSAEERLLFGTWTPKSAPGILWWHFWPDGRSAYGRIQPSGVVRMIERDGRWFVRCPDPDAIRSRERVVTAPKCRRDDIPAESV